MPLLPSLSLGEKLALGIVVGLISTCVQSLGLTLQRKSHMLEDSRPSTSPQRPAYRRRRWQVGMFLFLIANIVGSSIQITTLPLPLLSTLQASGLVFNSILASLLLKEAFTWRTGIGTVLVAAGAAVISISALPESDHTLRELLELLGYRSFLVWFILSLVLVVALLAADLYLRKAVRETPRLLLIRGMSYGAISGILSAHSLLLAKSAVNLIVRSITDHDNQFANWRSWILVLAFLILALSQLYYLHLGLRLVSTSILYPFVFCVYNIVTILDGLIYFRQMDRLPPLYAGLIAIGTVVLLAGVLALSWRLSDDDDTEENCGHEGHHKHRHSMAQHGNEIPQTVLLPGLGFVGEPATDSDEGESAVADDEETASISEHVSRGEQRPLLPKRSGTSKSSGEITDRTRRKSVTSRRRKRASTLKDVLDLWEEPGDDDHARAEEAYGTFESRRANGNGGRPVSADDRHVSIADEGADENLERGVGRSSTMPVGRSRSGRRRRSTHNAHTQPSGALFRDLLDVDWWRTRRKSGGDKPDEG